MSLARKLVRLPIDLGIAETDEQATLLNDVKRWEEDAYGDEANKVQQMYVKLHKGIVFRIFEPLLYIFAFRWAKNMLTNFDSTDDKVFDDYDE